MNYKFRLRSVELLIILMLVCLSCAPKTLPPELKPAYTANEVLIRIQELQTTVINLSNSNQITKDRADLIVNFCVASAKGIKESISGDWKSTLKVTWTQLKLKIGIPENGLQSLWLTVDYMISTL